MYDIFLSIDENTKLEELEKIVRYNIGKANILREKIKELDKVEMLTEKRSNEIKEIQKEEEVDSEEIEEEEYIYYYRNMKKEIKKATNQEEIIDAILDTLPSCENKSYSSIVNRIKLELLKEIHQRGMKLVMDLVVNHTSDQHRWFQEGTSGQNPAYRDYYIWETEKPNRWGSWFGGSAWEYNTQAGAHYLHIFAKKQPDLNWQNPTLRDEIYRMMSWWLNKGIDGFRMDVISLISKPDPIPRDTGSDLSPYCINGPQVHTYLKEMRQKVLAKYDIMTVGECPGITVQEAQKYAGTDSGELNMVFQFEHTSLTDGKYGKWSADRTDLVKLKEVLNRWQNGLRETSWNCLFWGNHDQPRAVSKFGCDLPEYRVLSAKMLCACLYLMQGTPYIYQGEEIGMPNPHFTSLEQYRDIESICAYHDFVDSGVVEKRMMLTLLAHTSRDNARTPMQWNSRFCAGFSSAPPWISLGYSWRAVNVEQEEKDENSVLHFYRDILAFRKGNPLIRYGTFELLCADDPHIFAYVRTYQGKRLLVICNFSEKSQNAAAIYPNPEAIRFHNYPSITPAVLRPFELIAAL